MHAFGSVPQVLEAGITSPCPECPCITPPSIMPAFGSVLQALEAGIVRHLQTSNTAIEDAMKQLEGRMGTAHSKGQDLVS